MHSVFSLLRRRPVPVARPVFFEDLPDAELVRAARANGRDGKTAFVEIVRRHQTAVCAVAYSLTGRISLTDDIAQEVFLKAWKRLHTLREPAKLRAWLIRIAHDCAVDALRREPAHLPLTEERTEGVFSTETPPDFAVAEAEEEALVWAALARLPENLRTPLVLFYREGQSVAAVAEALDLSPDAVKQRLSRGRNALREHVAAKIETALSRTQPSAVLIVAVAAAIGAFTAPGALAAGAFSTAAASGGTPFFSTSATTTMTVSPWLTAAAALAIFIPVGWNARPLPASNPPPDSTPGAKETTMLRERAEGSGLLAEWRRLHEIHGADAAAMPGLYEDIAKLENPFRRRALRSALLAEWAAVDPAGAFQNILTVKKQADQTIQLMTEWLKLDPAAAAAHLAANVAGFENGALELLENVAKVSPENMVRIARQLPAAQHFYDVKVQDAFAVYALQDLKAAREAAETFTGARRAQALAGLAAGWAEKDGPAALAWTQALPEGAARETALKAILTGWAKADPAAALDHLHAAPPGGVDGHFASDTAAKVLRIAAEKDTDATFAWLEKNGGTLGREAWLGLTNVIQKRLNADPAGTLDFIASRPETMRNGLKTALESEILNDSYRHRDAIREWLQKQGNGAGGDVALVKAVRDSLLSAANWQEPTVAATWLAEMPDSGDSAMLMQRNFTTTVSQGASLETVDALLAKAPEKQREALLLQAFGNAADYSEEDIKPWLARLETLPPPSRERAVSGLVTRMAGADPQRAAEWITTLPEESERRQATGSLALVWAGQDSYEASRWIAGMPSGAERDTASRALAQSIASVEPESAWTWAESIGGASQRSIALTSVVDAVHQRDPARARQMVQQSGLNTNERAELLNHLNNNFAPAK